ncbi:DUF3540 domain-containing protein [Alteromonas sp. a30]|uniref:DUF3540 domain-containing protein n=1 Tax=Alteromonas sp. a30 TaxID=2730917 RepID=UPI002280FAE6|nr:DUF3540 domain-containing protein [Alteromonas sp. a30]MCY7293845.1 DUF3540 domain-containing protein [Alteromonas sp. a30]
MMNQAKINHKVTPITPPKQNTLQVGEITADNQSDYSIDHRFSAKKALSCLLNPELGDQVLYYQQGEHSWIVSVLESECDAMQAASNEQKNSTTKDRIISINNQAPITLETARFTVNAKDSISMNAAQNIQLTAVLGKLSISARSLIQSVQESCISLAKHWLNRAEYIDQEAEKLLKTHAQHQLMTAEKDVKVDAERINMG